MSDQIVYGIHAVSALLSQRCRKVRVIYVNSERTDQRLADLLILAAGLQILIEPLAGYEMNRRFAGLAHQGVVASTSALPAYTEHDLAELLSTSLPHAFILILDGVTDPHNLGACLRSADAAGVNFVIIPKDKNASINPVVSKVASGAAESMPLVRVTNLARAMDYLKQQGVWIYGAAAEAATSIYNLDTSTALALVMGAEGDGIRHLTRAKCDGMFALPMQGSVSSLNVSVATGICLFEVLRSRNYA